MAATKCPTCGTEGPDSDRLNDGDALDDAYLTCAYCGYVGIWDRGAQDWRIPTSEERQVLLGSEEYLDMMEYTLTLRGWHDRDRLKLRNILLGHNIPEDLVNNIVGDILSADFHTHPSRDERDLMLPMVEDV